jgi:predicted metal-dependent hydrolase
VTVRLPGGPLEVVLRRSPRARRLRVTIDHRRGVVVTLPDGRGLHGPVTGRERTTIERFLGEREAWLRRHLARRDRSAAAAPVVGEAGLTDGSTIRYLGEPHRIRLVPAAPSARRSTVSREGAEAGDELVLRLAPSDRRPPDDLLRDWLIARARVAIERTLVAHADPMGVAPTGVSVRDPRTRWGSASRARRLSFSWRLILAPPEALETVVVHELAHLRVFGHGPAFWAIVAGRRPDHVTWRRWLRRHAAELHATLESDRTVVVGGAGG